MTYTSKEQVVTFDEFFERGGEEAYSPFLTPRSRLWAKNLDLKASLLAAVFLLLAFGLQFIPGYQPLSSMLLVGVYFFAGVPSLIDSIYDIFQLEVNIDVLMTLAAFSSVLIGSPVEGGLLLVLFALSGSMEEAVESKAKGAISSLYRLSPSVAIVVEPDGQQHERSVNDITPGTHIRIKAGEVVPLDGKVIEGASSVNLVHLTGENLPVTKKVGSEVPAGARNLEGALILEVTRQSSDSTLARIIRLVTQAQESKPKIQRWFDQFSQRYATTVIGLTALFALTLPLVFQIPYLGVEGSFYRAIAFLIAASPCALIIATPIAYLSAVSTCARKGIILKGGVTLDALDSCNTIAFDKTGTLTTGKLTLVSIVGFSEEEEFSVPEALSIAYAMEKNAVHPIARAITSYAEQQSNLPPTTLDTFKAVPGYGLQANVGAHTVYLGNVDFILPKLNQEKTQGVSEKVATVQEAGDLIALLLIDHHLFIFRFSDTIRPKMKETIDALKSNGRWRLLMLTGDHAQSANKVANELGIKEHLSELKPEDKLKCVSQLAKEGLTMVGDGINDAPALARATVGVSMGRVGSTTAIEAADIVLLHDNLEHLPWLMQKARKTQTIVCQNLTLAASVIFLATTPALLGWVPLWLAVTLHEGGTILVGLNALRLLERPSS